MLERLCELSGGHQPVHAGDGPTGRPQTVCDRCDMHLFNRDSDVRDGWVNLDARAEPRRTRVRTQQRSTCLDEWDKAPGSTPRDQSKRVSLPASSLPTRVRASQRIRPIAISWPTSHSPRKRLRPGASGSFRQPPIPSRPLGPDRSYISGGPALWYDPASQPISQPLSQPIPQMPVYGGYSPPPSGVSPRAAGKGNGRRRGAPGCCCWRWRCWCWPSAPPPGI